MCETGSFKPGYEKIFIEAGVFGVEFCGNCGLGRTVPLPEEAGEGSGADPAGLSLAARLLRRCFAGAGRRRIERFVNKDKGGILDIGRAREDFLSAMEDRGWTVHGLDADSLAAGSGAHAGLDILPEASFDAAVFWRVFGHIQDPATALRECARALKPGGALVMAVPNVKSLQARITGKAWFYLDPRFNAYHYTEANLRLLLAKSGFEVAEVRRFSAEYGPFGLLQSIYNVGGFRRNILYNPLSSASGRGIGFYVDIVQILTTLPLTIPIAVILAVVEAWQGNGGVMEIYARKRARPGT